MGCCQSNANSSSLAAGRAGGAEPIRRVFYTSKAAALWALYVSADEVSILIEVVVEGGVDGAELLQRLHLPVPQHCPFSSSEGQVGVLDPVAGPSSNLLPFSIAEVLHSGFVGAQPVGGDDLGPAVALS